MGSQDELRLSLKETARAVAEELQAHRYPVRKKFGTEFVTLPYSVGGSVPSRVHKFQNSSQSARRRAGEVDLPKGSR